MQPSPIADRHQFYGRLLTCGLPTTALLWCVPCAPYVHAMSHITLFDKWSPDVVRY